MLASLNPPASDDALAETERLIGRPLPDDVRAAYRRHDGQAFNNGLFDGWDWLSLEGVRREWTVWKDLLDGGTFDGIENDAGGRDVVQDWWNPGWVPVTASGSGDNHCVDLAPGRRGKVGQVITMCHDYGARPVLAHSFQDWLADFADELEAGIYTVSDEYSGLVHRRNLPAPGKG